MNEATRKARKVAAVGIIAGIGITGLATLPASAASTSSTNGQDQCLTTPAQWSMINHAAVTHDDKVVTPGSAAVTHEETRWSREVPAVDAVTHEETQYFRDIPGKEAVTHDEWRYSRVEPGLKEVWHNEHQFSRQNPGQAEVAHNESKFSRFVAGTKEVSHQERQFSRQNPGQAEVAHDERQFTRTNPGQQQQSHQEYKYSKQVPAVMETKYKKADVKTEYQYQKSVKGVVQKWNGYQWVNTGTTFDWEVYSHTSTQWSSKNVDVLEAGGHNAVQSQWSDRGVQYRKVTTNYQYVKNGNTREVPTGTYTYGWFTSNPGAPWVSTGVTQVKTPATTVHYNNGNWTTDVNPAGWTKVDERTVIDQQYVAPYPEYRAADGSATTDASNAGWFREANIEGWQQYGQPKKVVDQQYVAPFKEYRAADGSATTESNMAGWFREKTFEGWTQNGPAVTVIDVAETQDETFYLTRDDQGNLGESTEKKDADWIPDSVSVDLTVWKMDDTKKVIDQQYVAPFKEYRAADGSATTDADEAAWFREANIEGWQQYGQPKKVVDQKATEDETFYLTRDDQGNLGESTEKKDAAVFTSTEGVDLTKWTEQGRKTVTDQEAVPTKRVYLTKDADGVLGETDDAKKADWVKLGDSDVDLTVWQQMVNDHGDPLVRVVTDVEAIPGYTEYYVPGGEPTRELGESNWTTDEPEGWTFVDDREVTDKEAVPPTTTVTTVVDKAAWTEKKLAKPAKTDCTQLAITGGSDLWGPAGLGLLALAAGGTVMAVSARRRNQQPLVESQDS